MQDTLLLSADVFMHDTPGSSWVYAGYSCQQVSLSRILQSADGFMQDTLLLSAEGIMQDTLLLSADVFMHDTPVSRWVYAGYSC